MSASTAHEIGIVHYPGAQVACILGLTDLFGVASTIAVDQRRSGRSPLRVTHWQPLQSRDPNLSCVYDSAPRGSPKPRILIIPPTIERHAGGDCLLLVVLYRLLDGSHGEKAKLRPCWRQA